MAEGRPAKKRVVPPGSRKGMGGRPKGSGLLYTPELGRAIRDEIAKGVPLTVVTERMGLSYSTVCGWQDSQPEFVAMIARARDDAVERMFWETKQIADEQELGEVVEEADGPKGTFTKRQIKDMIEHRKLRVYTRFQIAGRHNPAKYAGLVRKEDGGGDSGGTELRVTGGLPDD